ncbi:MAG: ABC transporter permease [Chloroflexi bacterium]|nr:ABC transporter permease [Chloroflexota bacterium]
MTRIGRIFWREYWFHLTRRSYLLLTIGFPLFMLSAPVVGGIILLLAIRAAMPPTDSRPIGLIDQAGLLAGAATTPNQPVMVQRFADAEEAAVALAKGEIQAYYDIQPNYWDTGQVIVTYESAPSEDVDTMLNQWIQSQIRARASPEILARLDGGSTITHRDLAGVRGYSLNNMTEVGIVFVLIYFMRLGGSFTAEYMFGSIAGEANDRTLEILLTSVSPLQFLLGKLLGLLAVGLTQLGLWGGVVLALSLGTSALLGLDLTGFILNWEHLGLLVSVLLAAYLLDQVLAAALGLLRVSGGAGSLLYTSIGYVTGIGLIYAAYFVPRNPHTFLAVATSLFPPTAPLVLLVRVVVSEVPTWQIILSQLLLWGSSVACFFWLRWLLRANLVANTTPFNMRHWLKQKVGQWL